METFENKANTHGDRPTKWCNNDDTQIKQEPFYNKIIYMTSTCL